MTTRDPRLREHGLPDLGACEVVRDPTQSLVVETGDELDVSLPPFDPKDPFDLGRTADPPAPLALGTHDVDHVEPTKIASPGARGKTPAPPRSSTSRPPPMPSADDADDRLGEVLGSYRIDELIGKGGMGYVYRAEHTKLGRAVALKLLRSDYSRRRDAVARFFQEARTVNRVRHRNIVDVTDFVELDDGTTFIIMELLRGQSLGAWARPGVEVSRALSVLVQICEGLGAAHDVGVVHRDLKPDNVIIVPTSERTELVKLLDFGVAKLLNRDDEDVGFQTAAGSVIGTPAYMSPEQAGGMTVDARSDIYSLGAIMYELFCGQPMFRGRSFGEYVRKHLTELPVPPSRTPAGAGIDPLLETVILKALEKDPDHRYPDVHQMRDALVDMLGGLETNPPVTGSRRPATAVGAIGMVGALGTANVASIPPSVQAPTVMHGPAAARARVPWWGWLVAGTAALGLGIAATLWYAGRAEPDAAPHAPPTTPQPIVTPQAPQHLVDLRFDSLPSAAVYADGHSAQLCTTPCTFAVDLDDGGPTDRRAFIVRTEGYQDSTVSVDLASTQRAFHVTLLAMPAHPSEPLPDKSAVKHGLGRHPAPPRTDPTVVAKPEPPPPEPTTKPVTEPVVDPKPTTPKATIDSTDTLDPFHRKR